MPHSHLWTDPLEGKISKAMEILNDNRKVRLS